MRRAMLTLIGLSLLLALAVALRLAVGRGPGGLTFTWDFVWEVRLPRVVAGVIVGAALSVAGVFLQALLRNPLASPDILGLASGSGLAVMVGAWLVYARTGQVDVPPGLGAGGAAVVGALGALALVWTLSQRRGLLNPVTLVLVGVAVSVMASAGTMLIRHLLPDQGQNVGRLLLGSVRDSDWPTIGTTGVLALIAIAAGVVLGPSMDAASLSDDEARSIGVRLGGLRSCLFIASGVLTALSVVLAGPVGFVGLIGPHVVRRLAGPSHRTLVVGAALAGAALVVGCDTLVRAVDLGGGQMPIGVLTSLVGGPVLIVILRRGRGDGTPLTR